MTEYYILCIFPVLLIGLLCFGMIKAPRGEVFEDCWSLLDSKNLQVVAAYGVILHHLVQIVTKYGEINKGPITQLANMGILFTSIFFFYSGFGLMRSYIEKPDYLNDFLYKRLSVVLVPFLITNIFYILTGLADYRIYDVLGFFTSVFGVTLMNTNAWFLVEIIILYIAFYLAFKFIKNDRVALIALVIFTFLLIVLGLLLPHDYSRINGHWFKGEWWYNSTILFAVGLVWGKFKDEIKIFFARTYKISLAISVVLVPVLYVVEEYIRKTYGYYKETYTYMAYPEKLVTLFAQQFLCIVFVVLMLLIQMKIRFDNKVLSFVSAFSLEIYLIQEISMCTYSYEDDISKIIMFAMVIAISTVLGFFLHLLDEKVLELLDDYKTGELKRWSSIEESWPKKKKQRIVIAIKVVYVFLALGLVFSLVSNVYATNKVDDETANRLINMAQTQVGDEVDLGYFDIEILPEGEELMPWIVVDIKDDKVLLLSKYVLFGNSYNQKHMSVTYADSTIAEMLREQFLYEVFTDTTREYLIADEECGDLVFLLSQSQLEELNLPEDIVIGKASPVGKRWGVNIDGQDENSWWWLRNDESTMYAPTVNSQGEIVVEKEVNRASGGVRPAIWIKTK